MEQQAVPSAANGLVEPSIAGDNLAGRAISFAQKYKTPMSPMIYSVWYAYCARENKAINEALDLAMNTGQELTETTLKSLYTRYLSPEATSDKMDELGSNLGSVINDVTGVVEEKIKDHGVYSGALRSAKQTLAHGSSKADVSAVITKLHKVNQDHINSSRRLAVQLEKKRAEVAKLKTELLQLKRLSNTDYLTGLPNRRLLDDQVSQAIFDARQRKQQVAFIMGSVDNLTYVTNQFGMAVGDSVLRVFSEEIQRHLRGEQIAARFEGARFAALLPNAHSREAFAIAERVRKNFKTRDWVSEKTGTEIGVLTVSFGGTLLKSGEDREQLVMRADKLLTQVQHDTGDATLIE